MRKKRASEQELVAALDLLVEAAQGMRAAFAAEPQARKRRAPQAQRRVRGGMVRVKDRVAAGLCLKCGRERRRGSTRTLCMKCKLGMRRYMKARWQRLLAKGVCGTCGQREVAEPGGATCRRCLDAAKDRRRKQTVVVLREKLAAAEAAPTVEA